MVKCMKHHKVSVVIPVYNRDESLRRAVESVQGQSIDVHEIIIVDDCSTIELSRVVAELEDPRIRYLKLKRNRGAGYARNLGVRIATGDLIAFLDSDDIWYPEKLEQQILELDTSGAAVVYCPVDTENMDGRVVMTAVYKGYIEEALLRDGNVVVGGFSSVLIRRDAFCSVGGIRTSLRARQDYELHLRLAMAGWCYSHTDRPGLFFKTVGGNRITSNHYSRILGLLEVYRLFGAKFLEHRSQHGILNLYEVQRHLICLGKVRFAKVIYRRMLKSFVEVRIVNVGLMVVMLKGLVLLLKPSKFIE